MKRPVARLVFDFPEASSVHRVRNLGKDIWRAFRDDRFVSIELANVDRATRRMTIDLHYTSHARLKHLRKVVDEVVAKNLMSQEAQISPLELNNDT